MSPSKSERVNVRPWIDGRLKSGAFFGIGDADCVGDSTFSFWIIAEDEELSSRSVVCDCSSKLLLQAIESESAKAIKIIGNGFNLR